MFPILDTFVTIIFVAVALFMVLSILLQSGRGGGLGAALGGGSSQSVFGGSGGADFVARLTQAFAAIFMISAMYLAYSSAHAGSDFLRSRSKELEIEARKADGDDAIDYETVGPNPLALPSPEQAKMRREAMGGAVEEDAPPPADEPADGEAPVEGEPAPADEPPADEPPADPSEAEDADPDDQTG